MRARKGWDTLRARRAATMSCLHPRQSTRGHGGKRRRNVTFRQAAAAQAARCSCVPSALSVAALQSRSPGIKYASHTRRPMVGKVLVTRSCQAYHFVPKGALPSCLLVAQEQTSVRRARSVGTPLVCAPAPTTPHGSDLCEVLRSALTVVWAPIPHRGPAPAVLGCRQPRGPSAPGRL